MATLLKILAALPGALTAAEKIVSVLAGLLERYFPAKTPVQRALEARDKEVKETKKAKLQKNEAIKAAKRGYTKAIEDSINNPK